MSVFEEILKLKQLSNKQRKGYLFEQAIREIQPWDFKPAITAIGDSEQFDGIYTWKGITFLIESKAKEKKITRGSSDWEDHELKINKRIGKGVIGIYCSLYEVNDNVYEGAKELNIRGAQNMVLAGSFWEEMAESNLRFDEFLEFMIPYIRLKNEALPPPIKKIILWCRDKKQIKGEIEKTVSKFSSTFLRRFKHKYHNQIYVSREIDNYILKNLDRLKPSSIKKFNFSKSSRTRSLPHQFLVLRDVSGAGKTTLSVNFGNGYGNNICYVNTAKDMIVDQSLVSLFEEIGVARFLTKLDTINQPILYIIDSLDESKKTLYDKRQEILGLINYVQELNRIAIDQNLCMFPILILFTVREDYWRDWENLFEDRRIKKLTKRISNFNNLELNDALIKYSSAYNYSISNELSTLNKKTLSQPVILSIFSEAYEFEGEIEISDIWEEKILHKYFQRKKEDILKHPIPNLTSAIFLKIISRFAIECIRLKENKLDQRDINDSISNYYPELKNYNDELIMMLRSEQLLVLDLEIQTSYRFKHSKFIEFLSAYHIVSQINNLRKLDEIENLTNEIFESGIVSMFNVHDNIRYISKIDFPEVFDLIDEFYASSEAYMSKKVQHLRSSISVGERTHKNDLNLILKKNSSRNSDLSFQCFFVIAAKHNSAKPVNLLNLFILAWKSNIDRSDKWKMVIKMGQHNLLLNEKVISSIQNSNIPKEWEVYLGALIDNGHRKELKRLILDEKFYPQEIEDKDWNQVKYLIDIVKTDKHYIKGRLEQ